MLLASESFCRLFSTSFFFLSLNVQRSCQLNLLLQWAISFVFVDMYILLTKREVKMAEYWPSSVFMDRDEVEGRKNAKRDRGQYPSILTELAWPIKDLLYGIKWPKNDLRTCLFSNPEKETS